MPQQGLRTQTSGSHVHWPQRYGCGPVGTREAACAASGAKDGQGNGHTHSAGKVFGGGGATKWAHKKQRTQETAAGPCAGTCTKHGTCGLLPPAAVHCLQRAFAMRRKPELMFVRECGFVTFEFRWVRSESGAAARRPAWRRVGQAGRRRQSPPPSSGCCSAASAPPPMCGQDRGREGGQGGKQQLSFRGGEGGKAAEGRAVEKFLSPRKKTAGGIAAHALGRQEAHTSSRSSSAAGGLRQPSAASCSRPAVCPSAPPATSGRPLAQRTHRQCPAHLLLQSSCILLSLGARAGGALAVFDLQAAQWCRRRFTRCCISTKRCRE